MVASALTTAAAVLALLASSAAAEQMDTVSTDVIRTVEDGVAAGGSDMQTRVAGVKRYTGVGGNVPDKCVVYVDPYYPLTAGDSVDEDERDRVSGYVCTDELSDYEWTPNMFQTKKAQENGGFTLRMVSNGMSYNDDSAWGVDWYLAVHDYYKSDTKFPGYVRAILHKDETKAAVWDLEPLPEKKTFYRLKLVANRDSSAAYTEGWYLTVPPESTSFRDPWSNYVAVTDDPSEATSVYLQDYS